MTLLMVEWPILDDCDDGEEVDVWLFVEDELKYFSLRAWFCPCSKILTVSE